MKAKACGILFTHWFEKYFLYIMLRTRHNQTYHFMPTVFYMLEPQVVTGKKIQF